MRTPKASASSETSDNSELDFLVEQIDLVEEPLRRALKRALMRRSFCVSLTREQVLILVDGLQAARVLGERAAAAIAGIVRRTSAEALATRLRAYEAVMAKAVADGNELKVGRAPITVLEASEVRHALGEAADFLSRLSAA
jgi:hypothetical protein